MKQLFFKFILCACMLLATHALFSSQSSALAQGITITGTVTDDSGIPLPGTSISVQGTLFGVVTDANGKYSINVPSRESVLVFSFVGFTTQEFTVGMNNVINVSLVEGVVIEEVVVTALGIKREAKALSYSVTEMKGEDIANTPEINIMNSLQGMVAGVDIASLGTGAAGSSRVTIRGNTSISRDNNPLYVIDGVPISRMGIGSERGRDMGDALTTLNPNDIETMSILKGAAATALYGSRASNGVIMITTKNGRQQKGIGISYNGSFGIESYDNPYTGKQRDYGNAGLGGDSTDAYITQWNHEVHRQWGPRYDGRKLLDPKGNPLLWNNEPDKPLSYSFLEDHWKEFMRIGTTASNNLSLSGGGGNQRYRVSLSDMRYNSPIPNSNMNRQTIQFSTNSMIGKKVTFNARVNYSTAKTINRPDPNLYVRMLALIPTNIPIEWMKGDPNKWGANTSGDGKMLAFSTNDYYNNPYWTAYQDRSEDTRNRLAASGDLRIEIMPWLFVTGRVGIENQMVNMEIIDADGFLRGQGSGRGRVLQYTATTDQLNADYGLVFNKGFGKFDVSAMFGGSITRDKYNRVGVNGEQMVIEFWNVINNARTITQNSDNSNSGINSLYGNFEISYNNMVYLNVSGRNDWFSALNPAAKNNIFYPSVGLSYLLSQQFTLPRWWTFAKLRATYTEVGGGAGAYQTKLAYNMQSNGYLGTPWISIPGTLNNPLLMPYNTREYEVGLDFRFFNNRVTVDYAWYDKETYNDIVTVSNPRSTGYTGARVNLGAIGNIGHELTLSFVPVKTKDLEWRFNIAYANNIGKILSLGDVDRVNNQNIGVGGSIDIDHLVGQRPYGIYGYTQRTENGQKAWQKAPQKTTDGQDYNAWYHVPTAEKVFWGYGVHPNAGSISTQVRWKGLTFSAMVDAKWGAKMVYVAEDENIQRGLAKSTLPGRDGGLFLEGVYNNAGQWVDIKTNPSTTLRAVAGNTLQNDVTIAGNEVPYHLKYFEQYYRQGYVQRMADMLIFDGSYAKLRQVSIGYSLPGSIFGNVPIQSAYVSITGRNLFDFYNKLPGGDPSIGSGNGVNNMALPALKTFMLNINVNF